MIKFKFFLISAVFLNATVLKVNALKCWRCSSDASSSEFCNDPFDQNNINITEQRKRWTYVDCSLPPGTLFLQLQPVCKKSIKLINESVVISRSCSWEDKTEPIERNCAKIETQSFIKTQFCKTCDYDGCNGEPMN